MEVVLIEKVAKLGQPHDVVRVRPGYARNFLFPEKKAILATPAALAKAAKVQAVRVKKLEEIMANAKSLAEKLKDITLTFKQKVKGDKLYGSIGAKEIVAAMEEAQKIELSKDMVHLSKPIKTVGDHKVTLRLAEGVEVKVTVTVVGEEA